jgi:hypothetical protein
MGLLIAAVVSPMSTGFATVTGAPHVTSEQAAMTQAAETGQEALLFFSTET